MPVPRAGIVAALWTPTDAQGRILRPELEAHLAFLQRQGIHGLMILGSTGEFLRLSLAERRACLEIVRAHAGALPTLVNISHLRPAELAELGRFARGLGFDSISLLPPWFYPLAQEDLAEFFIRAAEAVALPLFLYNFPERTGHRLELDTIAAVAGRVPLAGVKQSGGEFGYHEPLVALGRRENFVVFTGGEPRLAEALALGVTGCVSGLANAVPELVLEIYNATKAGATERVAQATARIRELVRCVSKLSFPLDVAAAMAARGLPVGQTKTPLSAATHARYAQVVAELRRRYADWGLT